jgi:DNA uptake protein ComE-like DNA-binding protein
MDKKSVTETAADAAKVAVGIAAMAVDALMGADQTAEKDRSGTGDVGRQETAKAGGSDQPASKIQEERNNPEAQQSRDSGVEGSGYAPAKGASPSDANSTEAQNSSGAININKAKFDELVSLKHIGRGRAKRIIASRPFRSVEDLASQGIVPADTLAELRNRLAV